MHKVLRAGFQSGSIMCLADVTTQVGIEGKRIEEATYDPFRTFRWAIAGFILHGPYFSLGFSKLDRFFGPATSISTVIKKTAAAQFILFPPYLVGIFGFMGVLEGCQDVPKKVIERVPEAFLSGCVFWPISNMINFACVPAPFRIPYLATSAGVWNSYLSWTNAR